MDRSSIFPLAQPAIQLMHSLRISSQAIPHHLSFNINMPAHAKPDVEGTPFASDEWKKAVAYLAEVGEGHKPVRLATLLLAQDH